MIMAQLVLLKYRKVVIFMKIGAFKFDSENVIIIKLESEEDITLSLINEDNEVIEYTVSKKNSEEESDGE